MDIFSQNSHIYVYGIGWHVLHALRLSGSLAIVLDMMWLDTVFSIGIELW